MKRIFLLLLLAAPMLGRAQSPQDLYQEGLRLERAQGDLPGAIALFKRVAANFGSDRALGAQALLRIGQAYETLGETEAERAYRRVIAEFADQQKVVAAAHEALGRMAGPEPTQIDGNLGVRELLRTGGFWGASFSEDGRYFINSDWEQGGRLAYQDTRTGEIRYITAKPTGPPPTEWAYSGRFSPDNQRIAYVTWHADSTLTVDLYDQRDESHRVIFDPQERSGAGAYQTWLVVYGWTSDGNHLLFYYDYPGEGAFALLDVSTGEITNKILLEDEEQGGADACLVDDRTAVYQVAAETRVADFRDGSKRTIVSDGTMLMGCSRSKGIFVLRSELFGESSAWMYRMSGGRLQGGPVAIPRPLGESWGITITNGGTLAYYDLRDQRTELFGYDGAGTATSARVISKGWARGLGWTRDGEHYAFMRNVRQGEIWGPNGSSRSIDYSVYIDSIDRKEGVGHPKIKRRRGISADGSRIIAANLAADGKAATYWIDPDGGAVVDSIEAVYGAVGFRGVAILDGARRDPETMCLREFTDGSSSPVTLLCYADAETTWISSARLSPSGKQMLVLGALDGSPTPHLDPKFQPYETFAATVLEFATGDVSYRYLLEEGEWAQWLPPADDLLIYRTRGEPEERFRKLSPATGSQEVVFERLAELRQSGTPWVNPVKPLLTLFGFPVTMEGPTDIQAIHGLWDFLDSE